MRRAIAVVMLVAGGLTVMGAWPMGSNYNGRSFMSAGGPALRTLRIGIVTAVALAAALVATMALAPRAEAFVYSIERNNMVRANNDGSDVQPTLIAPAITGVGSGG